MAGHGTDELDVGHGLSGVQDLAQRGGEPVGLAAGQEVVRGAAAVPGDGAAESLGETLVDAQQGQVGAEEEEAERRLAENSFRCGDVGLYSAQRPDVDGDAEGGAVAGGILTGHHIDLGQALFDAIAAVAAVAAGTAVALVRDEPGPGPAVEAALGEEGGGGAPAGARGRPEDLLRVLADGVPGRYSEEFGRPFAPLVDPAVGAEGEGRHTDVVVEGAGWTVLPHRRGVRIPRLSRRTRWLFAHVPVPSGSCARTGIRRPSIQHRGPSEHGLHDHSTVSTRYVSSPGY